jgi:hypothetical protein
MPELDGVPAGLGVGQQVEHLALGDPELLADQVEPAGLLRDRVLDLQAGVDLQEGDQPVLADEELDGAGAVVAGLPADRLGASWMVARWSSVRNGAGASSTSFWNRRCSEQSRVPTTMTLPCVSASTWASTWRGLSR